MTAIAQAVYLNVYDLADNSQLYNLGLGSYHSGVEIHGEEWTFASGAGVFSHPPKGASGAVFRERVFMGEVSVTRAELASLIARLRPDWPGTRYNIITSNCNHFSEALVRELTGHGIPGWVNRLSYLGSLCSCLIPRAMTQRAPVDGEDAVGSGSSRGGSRSHTHTRAHTEAFSGTGHRLGAGDDSSTGGSEPTAAQRERAVDGIIASLYSAPSAGTRTGSTSSSSTSTGTSTRTDAGAQARMRETMAAAALRRVQASS